MQFIYTFRTCNIMKLTDLNTSLTLRFQRPVQNCICGSLGTESCNQTRWGRRSAPGRRTPSHHSSWRRSSGCRCSAESRRMNTESQGKGGALRGLCDPVSRATLLENTNQMSQGNADRNISFPLHPFFTLKQVEHLAHNVSAARQLHWKQARLQGGLHLAEPDLKRVRHIYMIMSAGINWIWSK